MTTTKSTPDSIRAEIQDALQDLGNDLRHPITRMTAAFDCVMNDYGATTHGTFRADADARLTAGERQIIDLWTEHLVAQVDAGEEIDIHDIESLPGDLVGRMDDIADSAILGVVRIAAAKLSEAQSAREAAIVLAVNLDYSQRTVAEVAGMSHVGVGKLVRRVEAFEAGDLYYEDEDDEDEDE